MTLIMSGSPDSVFNATDVSSSLGLSYLPVGKARLSLISRSTISVGCETLRGTALWLVLVVSMQ